MTTTAKTPCPQIDKLIGVAQSEVTSLVDEGVEIEGTIRIKNAQAILITGTVIGNIESNGAVVINTTGEVRGSINAKALQIAGRVVRDKDTDMINVDGPLVLQETAYLGCDAESVGVQMAYGASIDGSIRPRKEDGVAVPLQRVTPAAVPVAPAKPVVAVVTSSAPVSTPAPVSLASGNIPSSLIKQPVRQDSTEESTEFPRSYSSMQG